MPLRSVPRAGSSTRTESDFRFSEGENLISWLTKLYWLILTSESLCWWLTEGATRAFRGGRILWNLLSSLGRSFRGPPVDTGSCTFPTNRPSDTEGGGQARGWKGYCNHKHTETTSNLQINHCTNGANTEKEREREKHNEFD